MRLRRDCGIGIGIGWLAGLRELTAVVLLSLAPFTAGPRVLAAGVLLTQAPGAGVLLAQAPAAGEGHLVIISGLSGEERFARDFLAWGASLSEAAGERFGVRAENVVWLAEDAGAHGGIRGRSTREVVERELTALAGRAGAEDRVLIVVFGHGSYQGGESRINLPGPDIDAKALAALLGRLRTRHVAVVNTTSASGGFIQALAAPGRIVVTATKSGMEANETVFGGHFTSALTGDASDTDKDGRVSLLEAFEYARQEVEREYQRANKLLTEHAVIDAVGDGRGATELTGSGPHVLAARAFHLGAVASAAVGASPELRALYEDKARIEAALDALRTRRAELPAAEYDDRLESLLVELARNAQEIRRIEGGVR